MKTYEKSIASRTQVTIVTALMAEAKPLIQQLRLKRLMNVKAFSVYRNRDRDITLIITGIGAVKTAAAVAFWQQYCGNVRHHCWLNIGIAGSGWANIGALYIGHKIVNAATGQAWYPKALLLPSNQQQTMITSYQKPQRNYPSKGLVDMEAAPFFQAASLFVTQEQIQVAKVVSDHDHASQQAINAQQVSHLIAQQSDVLVTFIERLNQLSAQESQLHQQPEHLPRFLQHWRFSQFEQQQLTEYLRRFEINFPSSDPLALCHQLNSSQAVLTYLQQQLDTVTEPQTK